MVSELSETSHGVGSLPNLYVHDYAYVWRGLAWTLVMCLAPSIDEWIWADLGIEYSKLWICLLEKCVACSTELTCTYWMNFSIYQEWIWPFLLRDFDTLICGGEGWILLSLFGGWETEVHYQAKESCIATSKTIKNKFYQTLTMMIFWNSSQWHFSTYSKNGCVDIKEKRSAKRIYISSHTLHWLYGLRKSATAHVVAELPAHGEVKVHSLPPTWAAGT
jgi:hypothetical protein